MRRIQVDGGRIEICGSFDGPTGRPNAVLLLRRGGHLVTMPLVQDGVFTCVLDVKDLAARLPLGPCTVDLRLMTDRESVRAAQGLEVDGGVGLAARDPLAADLGRTTLPGGVQVWPWMGPDGLAIRFERPAGPEVDAVVLSARPAGAALAVVLEVISREDPVTWAQVEVRARGGALGVRRPLTVLTSTYRAESRTYRLELGGRLDLAPFADPRAAAVLTGGERLMDVRLLVRRGPAGAPEQVEVRAREGTRPDPVVVRGAGGVQVLLGRAEGTPAHLVLFHESYPAADFRHLRLLVAFGWALAAWGRVAGVWLVGDTPHWAQGDAFVFFRWLREHRPEVNAWYVLAADSPDLPRLQSQGRVVVHGSRRHMRLSLAARRIVSSRGAGHVLASRLPAFDRAAGGVRVLLLHGPLGMRHAGVHHPAGALGGEDLVCVASEVQRELLVNDLHRRHSRIAVTGTARLDALHHPPTGPGRGVLILPSWREDLVRRDTLLGTEYLARWTELITHPDITALTRSGVPVTFCLHPAMTRFTRQFHAPGVKVIPWDRAEIQQLLRDHRVLVTDYATCGFDAAGLGRAVVYYQFDRPDLARTGPAHLDPEVDLPGTVCREAGAVVQAVGEQLAQIPVVAGRRERLARWAGPTDGQSSRRVYHTVVGADHGSPADRLWAMAPLRGVRSLARSGPWGRALVRTMAALRRLGPREDSVVFCGSQEGHYADSPRAVYEEMVTRRTGLRHYWVSASTFRPPDTATRKLVPGSPTYHRRLAAARYWVTDGPLPVEVGGPARGTFHLQTWHGQGDGLGALSAGATRDPAELRRLVHATGRWDGLVASSPYGTRRLRALLPGTRTILRIGAPRNDVLVGPGRAERGETTRARLGLARGARPVLYAPSPAGDRAVAGGFDRHTQVDWELFDALVPPPVVLLVRGRGLVADPAPWPRRLAGRIVDVSDYPDAQDLLCAVDALVTDVSPLIFDFAATGRPAVVLCPASRRPEEVARDLPPAPPGPVVRSQAEAFAALRDIDALSGRWAAQVASFARMHGPWEDGHAAARAVDALLWHGRVRAENAEGVSHGAEAADVETRPDEGPTVREDLRAALARAGQYSADSWIGWDRWTGWDSWSGWESWPGWNRLRGWGNIQDWDSDG